MKLETILAFCLGTAFLCLLVYAALRPGPPLTQEAFYFLRVICALAAAGFAAVVPGFLNIELAWLRNSVRAGGALAVFVVIYLVNPPTLGSASGNTAVDVQVDRGNVNASLLAGSDSRDASPQGNQPVAPPPTGRSTALPTGISPSGTLPEHAPRPVNQTPQISMQATGNGNVLTNGNGNTVNVHRE